MKRDGTEKIRARYDRISPYYDLMELLLKKLVFSRWRGKIFGSLDGDTILEVGVGTGKNLEYRRKYGEGGPEYPGREKSFPECRYIGRGQPIKMSKGKHSLRCKNFLQLDPPNGYDWVNIIQR